MVGSVWVIIIIHEVGLIGKVGETCTSPKNHTLGTMYPKCGDVEEKFIKLKIAKFLKIKQPNKHKNNMKSYLMFLT